MTQIVPGSNCRILILSLLLLIFLDATAIAITFCLQAAGENGIKKGQGPNDIGTDPDNKGLCNACWYDTIQKVQMEVMTVRLVINRPIVLGVSPQAIHTKDVLILHQNRTLRPPEAKIGTIA